MGLSFCKYENKENCELIKSACVPGQKGCVIKSKIKSQKIESGPDSEGYKSNDIARFKKRD
jgi:hypothetical protein